MGFILIIVFFVYFVIAASLTKSVNDSTISKPKKWRILYRAFLYTIIWGLGPIGAEGFALAGPLLISIPFTLLSKGSLGAEYLPLIFVIWFVIFLLLQLLYEKMISTFTPKEIKKSDGSEWFQ